MVVYDSYILKPLIQRLFPLNPRVSLVSSKENFFRTQKFLHTIENPKSLWESWISFISYDKLLEYNLTNYTLSQLVDDSSNKIHDNLFIVERLLSDEGNKNI